jgi:hypothetical protein
MVRQQTWQDLKTEISSRRRWSADVGIASAISKSGVFARRHGVPCMFDSLRV